MGPGDRGQPAPRFPLLAAAGHTTTSPARRSTGWRHAAAARRCEKTLPTKIFGRIVDTTVLSSIIIAGISGTSDESVAGGALVARGQPERDCGGQFGMANLVS